MTTSKNNKKLQFKSNVVTDDKLESVSNSLRFKTIR